MTPAQRVHERAQLIFWACGIGFAFCFFGGLYPLMHFIPPPSPLLSGEEVMALYGERLAGVKAGIVLGILGAGMLVPWSAMVAMQVARMEGGRRYPLWALTSLCAGGVNAVFFTLPFIFWAGAFYRPERLADLVQLLNDMTWLEFVMIFPAFSIQLLCVACAGLTQKEGSPVFPRWYLFVNLWMALLGAPGLIAIFFYTGPFAWNGVIGFWLPVLSYALFLVITYVQFFKAIRSHKNSVDSSARDRVHARQPGDVDLTLRSA